MALRIRRILPLAPLAIAAIFAFAILFTPPHNVIFPQAPDASEDDAMRESTACGQGYCAPSVEIVGLSRRMTVGDSDGFTVEVDNLDRTLRYRVVLDVNSSAS